MASARPRAMTADRNMASTALSMTLLMVPVPDPVGERWPLHAQAFYFLFRRNRTRARGDGQRKRPLCESRNF
jgi:hypothetical protein